MFKYRFNEIQWPGLLYKIRLIENVFLDRRSRQTSSVINLRHKQQCLQTMILNLFSGVLNY